jgi:prevent-host-death family protein
MDISIAEAKDRLSELIRAVEDGEKVVITRHGKPVAQITPPPPPKREVRFGTMRGRIHMKPGWDRPLTVDEFLSGDY